MEDWYGPDIATFGDRLAAAREAAGLSREDLAKSLGVKKSTLRAWEDDMSEPRANKLQMLSGVLNVTITWLLNGEGQGLGAPDDDEPTSDPLEIMRELREVQTTLKVQSERLARLEKRLRKSTEEAAA